VVLGNSGRSALIGFTADAVARQDGQRLFENLLDITLQPPAIQPLAVQPPSCVAAAGTSVTVTVAATATVTADNAGLVSQSLSWGDGGDLGYSSFLPTGVRTDKFSHTYLAAGLYRIAAEGQDARGVPGLRGADCLMAVYGAADSVKGSGWVASPAGAYKQDASIAGKATFGAGARRRWARLPAVLRACSVCCGRGRGVPRPAQPLNASTPLSGPQHSISCAAVRAKYRKGASKPTGAVKFSLPNGGECPAMSSPQWAAFCGAPCSGG
jgi:hypothetical protein